MFDYSNLTATAVRLIDQFGTTLTLTRKGDGAYDPSTGTVGGAPQHARTRAVKATYHAQEIDGTNILAGDAKVLVSPDIALSPVAGDSIEISGESLRVMRCDEIKPADTVVLYIVQARV